MKARLHYNAPVILSFTLAATAVTIIDTIAGGVLSDRALILLPTFEPGRLLSYLRFLSYALAHEGWMHLISNFSFVLLIGPILEEKYGSPRILGMIVFTVVVTGILNVLFFPTALRGASGVVFMLILLSSFTNFRAGQIPLTFVLVVLLFLTREIVDAVTAEDEISQFAHIIGGICGGAFGFLTTRREGRPGGAERPGRGEERRGTTGRPPDAAPDTASEATPGTEGSQAGGEQR